jgi:ELMO/CED-12 family
MGDYGLLYELVHEAELWCASFSSANVMCLDSGTADVQRTCLLLAPAGIPTPDQLAKFTQLRHSAQIQYNEDDPEHQVCADFRSAGQKHPAYTVSHPHSACIQVELAALWKQCFPQEPWYCGPSERWKDAGFQGSNPASDFRGGGIYSLRNLIYMSKNHRETFRRLLWKSTGQRSDFEYPFCAAGMPLFCDLCRIAYAANSRALSSPA